MEKVTEFNAFWGCNIPTNLPFVEKSARLIFEKLNLEVREIEGAICCPENDLTRRLDPSVALLISSINFALAENNGIKDMVAFCNGCYHSLEHAFHILQDDQEFNRVNEELKTSRLSFKRNIQLYPIVAFLSEKVGINRIKNAVSFPLSNFKVACHYGCRLQENNFTDYFDEVVRATGAQIIRYGLEKMCCGTPALYCDQDWSITERARNKLVSIKSSEADIIVVSCPACFRQLEVAQVLLKRNKETYDLPILYITELLALAFGFSEETIGLEEHRIKVQR
ncbi:heterodisulfide reductase-related iron-sulfur binding cluster [Candidatus Hodarchaeum mangrovi]